MKRARVARVDNGGRQAFRMTRGGINGYAGKHNKVTDTRLYNKTNTSLQRRAAGVHCTRRMAPLTMESPAISRE